MADGKARFPNKTQRFRGPVENIIFPVILLLWPLAAANQGISVMDTTYSLANYRYPDTVNSMWKFATFLANEVGALLMKTAAGSHLLSMNIACSMVISLTAICAYLCLKKRMPGWVVFLAEFLAISLCWCPAVILYNYLTYLLLTLSCIFLLCAISGIPERKIWYVLAGVCLGANVTVRFSNAAEAALILALWFWCGITNKKVKGALQRTLYCLLGYVAGFAIPVAASAVMYGPTAYFDMIPELFGVQGSASDYTFGGMISSILRAYQASLRWLLVLALYVVLGAVLFKIPPHKGKQRVRKVLYVAGLCVIARLFYGRGMFTVLYTDYWSWFQWAMLLLDVTLILGLIFVFGGFSAAPDERFLAAMVLLLCLILPLGSNNYTFPVFNCLFIVAPADFWMLQRIWKERRKKPEHFALQGAVMLILVMVFIQGAAFHVLFAFRDGTDGTKRDAMVEGNSVTRGMYTTEKNAQELADLTLLVEEKGLQNQKTIVFGDAPGLHYLLSLEPAINTTWPDLDSYAADHFEAELSLLSSKKDLPLVIIHKQETAQSSSSEEKMLLLQSFMEENGYKELWHDDAYSAFLPAESGTKVP